MTDSLARPLRIYRDAPREWTLHFDGDTWTTNAERRMHHYERAAKVRLWRDAFFMLAKQAKVARLEAATVTVQPHQARGPIGDIGSIWPTAKAAIDGALVDAKVLDDDDPAHLLEVRLRPALRGPTGLSLTITEVLTERSSA